jgi:nucleoside phosphorylase
LSKEIGIVAALEREVKPATKSWKSRIQKYGGREFKFFENDRAVLVCGGIGAEASRRAAEAMISLYAPGTVVSIGFAGALEAGFKVGDLFVPRSVVDARDSSRIETAIGKGTLVSSPSIADEVQKRQLAKSYAAQVVDMEAASVGVAAGLHGSRFFAVKAISDELGFAMPPLSRFVGANGRFESWKFAVYCVLRPWLWRSVLCLAKNSARARQSLWRWLNQYNEPEFLKNNPDQLHPMSKIPS